MNFFRIFLGKTKIALKIGLGLALAFIVSQLPVQKARAQVAPNQRLKIQALAFVEGEVLVKLKNNVSLQSFSQKLGTNSLGATSFHIQKSWGGINMHRMKLENSMTTEQSIAMLKNHPDVAFVEPNYYVTKQSFSFDAQSVQTLSEAQAQSATLSSSSTQSYYQSDAHIQIELAWQDLSATAPPVVVAVIDSGVDYNHDVFTHSGAIWTNPHEIAGNGVDDDGNGFIDDTRGWNFVAHNNNPMDDSNHGTHVAGIIFGASQNILAGTLEAAKIKIMPLKFLDAQGKGTTSDAITAIFYAVNNGARIINNSWGGGGYSQSLRDAINYAYSKDSLFIAAAGNASSDNDVQATYPANYSLPNIFSIAATNDYDRLAGFSNFGHQTVHVASPGQSIFSTLPGNSMGYMSGTSMAAPLVSGLAGLILRENPRLTAYQIRSIIDGTSNFSTYLQGKISTESRINAYDAIHFAQTGNASQFDAHPTAEADRAPAAEPVSGQKSGGCAALLIGSIGNGQGPFSGPQSLIRFFGLLLLVVSPLVVLGVFKNFVKMAPDYRRKYDRYLVDTQVTIQVGDKQLQGAVKCISLGGARIDTDALLEKGGSVQLRIMSPDGKGTIEVEGHVVWSEQEKSYGVAFDNLGDRVRGTIRRWQARLIKT